MSDFLEAAGTAAEGSLWSRAVSKVKGGSPKDAQHFEKGHFAEDACLNCGTTLIGAHCHNCGQKAHLHRTLKGFVEDLMHGALHFDGKTWRTLPMLIFRPGKLTRDYIEGERARYVSPMALFLFAIFLMFAVFQVAGISTPTDLETERTDEVLSEAREQIGTLQERRNELAAKIDAGELGESELRQAQAEVRALDDQIEAVAAAQAVPVLKKLIEPDASSDTVLNGAPVTTEDDGTKTVPLNRDGSAKMTIEGSGIDWIDNATSKWRKNPTLMLYKLQTNFYKFSWLLIPLSIPFMWLLFAWKRRFKAYDHAIFVTYSLGFMSLFILTMVLIGLAGAPTPLVVFPSILVPPIHIYKQLRGAYGLSRFSALWRLLVLTVFIMVILTIFLLALMALGAF